MVTLPSQFSILHTKFLASRVTALAPSSPASLDFGSTLAQALTALAESKIGAVFILDPEKKLAGILTERDLLYKVARRPDIVRTAPAAEFMTQNPQSLPSNSSVARVLHLISVGGFRHVPITQSDGSPPQLISVKELTDFVYRGITKKLASSGESYIYDSNAVDMFFASPLSILNPSPSYTVKEGQSVGDALEIMIKRRIGSVVVLGNDNRVTGIFTERDYLMQLVQRESQTVEAASITSAMTAKPRCLPASSSVSLAFNLMSEGGYRHLPIVDSAESLIGILSVRNFVDYLAASIIEELK